VNEIEKKSNLLEMSALIRNHDWSSSSLGHIDSWSSGMRTALDLCLGSRLCSAIYWGPERLVLYNDAYSALLGSKHPWALGRPADDVWAEAFDVIGPLMRHTLETGEATGADDAAIFLNRSGYVEEYYCSFSYSPLINEFGAIEGVFTMFPETTTRVIAERRLATLQRLGAGTRELRHPHEVLDSAAQVFADNGRDIPFAGLYLWRGERTCAERCAGANIAIDSRLIPPRIDISADTPLARLLARDDGEDYACMPIEACDQPVPTGAWCIPAKELIFLRVEPSGEDMPKAFVLAGVNPYKRLDDAYLSFFRMLADQLAGALAEAFGHEQEDVRLKDMRERARGAQQEERVRIARDLHDTLLQSIQGLRFLLEAGIVRLQAGDPTSGELFARALGASKQAIEEGRGVLSLLRSSVPVNGDLSSSISKLSNALMNGSGIDFRIDIDGDERELQARVVRDIYGIAHEALVNASQHSRASSIRLRLQFSDELIVSIRDNGCGINADIVKTGRPGHFGIQGMRERAEKIGGEITIESRAAAGTVVRLRVPGDAAYAL
jgi:signal transduction histidine kinase